MNTDGLYFSKDHEWARVLPGGEVEVGISSHAQEALGDITFIDLPKIGKAFKAHEALAVVESVKAASDVYAPLSGTVSAVNTVLADEPEKVNQDPYGAGWLCRLAGCDSSGLKDLMNAEQYAQHVAGR
jgi:glycine cleavage system H protein